MYLLSRITTMLAPGTLLLVLAGCDFGSGTPCTATCSGNCVDLGSDPTNCGGCGVTCDPGVACMYGACLYGTVDISFSTSFIYDRELLNAGGSYRWDHADRAVQRSGALSAVFHDSTQIPPSGAQETLSYAIHYQNRPGSSRINVQQSSFVDDTYSNELYPQGRIAFLSDDLTTGDRLPIMLPGSNQDDGVLVYFVTVGLTESCVHAFAYGEWLDITLAANTTADEGGQLAFSATDVPVYHPTATPLGDITQGVADAAGLAVCPSGS